MATFPLSAQNRQPGDKGPSRDFRQEVTDNIIRMLEEGVAPWQKPWEPGAIPLSVPVNPTSERSYRGGNAIHLMATALRNGYDDPRWMTYKQATEQGWQVRRGEKGTQIEFWEVKSAARESQPISARGQNGAPENKNTPEKTLFVHRVYTVFNAKQIDGLPDLEPAKHSEFEAIQAGDRILTNSGARIAHDQADRAFYSRAHDSIHLPPRTVFKEPAGYYGTALHELAHWTGHPSRLNRQTLNNSYRFGDLNYAQEELRAELASVFLAAEKGIPHNPEHHAAYVGSWVKALREDKNEIFRAAHDASAAADFLLALERDRSIADEELASGPAIDRASGTAAAVVIKQTADEIHHDRERLEESEADRGEGNEPLTPLRQSTDITAHLEPGEDTVNIRSKQPGVDHRGTVESLPTNTASTRSSLIDAQRIAAVTLGPKAKALAAQTESGAYRGPIIGLTDQFVVQRQSSRFAVAHPRELLDRQPQVGQTVSISYCGSSASVRECRERSRSQERER